MECIKNIIPHAKTVIFLHGWGGNKYSFINAFNFLNSYGYSVISPDLPGFGDNKPLDRDYTIFDYCDDVREFIKSQNVDDFYVVCHSFGARILSVICNDFNIKKVVITGGAGIKEKFSLTKKLKIYNYKFKKFLCNNFGMDKKILYKYGSNDYKNLPDSMKKTFVNVVNEDLSKYFKSINAKVLLFWGRNDDVTPPYMAKKLNKIIPDCSVSWVGGGHFCYLENDFLFCNKVLDFFKGD